MSATDDVDVARIVWAMLRAADVTPFASEMAQLAARYGRHRAAMDAMYDVPMDAEELPVLTMAPRLHSSA